MLRYELLCLAASVTVCLQDLFYRSERRYPLALQVIYQMADNPRYIRESNSAVQKCGYCYLISGIEHSRRSAAQTERMIGKIDRWTSLSIRLIEFQSL